MKRGWNPSENKEKLNSFNEYKFEKLQHLTLLKELYIGNAKISNIDFLAEIVTITELYLSYNEISNIDPLEKLKSLRYLYLDNNSLKNIDILATLNPLIVLDLANNQIADIGVLEKHKELLYLNLDNNGVGSLSVLEKIQSLQYLYLSGNKVSDIGFVKGMRDLITLILNNNLLTNIDTVTRLPLLKDLNIRNNQITNIQPSLLDNLPHLVQLYLSGNPINNIPPEIFDKKSNNFSDVKDYFNSISQSEETYPCYEAKLLLVGRGNVGKSELAEALSTTSYVFSEGRKSTEGIRIKEWHLKCTIPQGREVDFTVNLWDLGGQESYYGTHQFFLTKNSLYLLVWDARQEEDNVTFDYWLRALSLLSENSPVLIVQNKADDRTKMLDQKDLKNHFPFIQDFYQTSCKFVKQYDLERLKSDIIKHLLSLQHVGELWNIRRISVRRKLERDKRNYIPLSEYISICKQEGLKEDEITFLSERLHRLGIILHFQDDPILQSTVILKPEWATKAFYKIIDNKKIKDEQKGNFNLQDLRSIWNEAYYEDKFPELLQLMMRFELCFQFQDQDRYIVPELCIPSATNELPGFNGREGLIRFEYRYGFMPKNIITRFICRNHKLIKGEMFWRSGVVLQDEEAIAVLQSSEVQKKISIVIEGKNAKYILYKIRKDMEEIHDSVKNPPFHEMIPCICSQCKSNDQPSYFKYEILKKHIEKNIPKIRCPESLEEVEVRILMEGILENQQDSSDEKAKSASITKRINETQGKAIQTIKIFLASSSELKEDREQFEIFINRENKLLVPKNLFLELIIWEDFIDAMSKERLQADYNRAIKESDIFISLFFKKVGKYTEEEFGVAVSQLNKTGKPYVYTYFKDADINMESVDDEIQTLLDFRKKLKVLGHFRTVYKTVEDLKYQFKMQLEKLLQAI